MKVKLFKSLIFIFRKLFPNKWKENINKLTEAEDKQRYIYELTGEEVSINALLQIK